jgi:hypothetical protein
MKFERIALIIIPNVPEALISKVRAISRAVKSSIIKIFFSPLVCNSFASVMIDASPR